MTPLKTLKLSSRLLWAVIGAKILHDLAQRYFFSGEELTLWYELGLLICAIGLDAAHRLLDDNQRAGAP